jgi:hypothetical protein
MYTRVLSRRNLCHTISLRVVIIDWSRCAASLYSCIEYRSFVPGCLTAAENSVHT